MARLAGWRRWSAIGALAALTVPAGRGLPAALVEEALPLRAVEAPGSVS